MKRRGPAVVWCWTGLAVAAVLGLLLSDARELFSLTERLTGITLGIWLPWHEVGLADTAWSWRITPLAAWWGIACGLTACLLGWQAEEPAAPLPMGVLGGLMWAALLTVLFADNLIVMTAGWCGQSVLIGLWLAWSARSTERVTAIRRSLATALLGDMIWITGVLLVGLAWRTFDFASLEAADFVHDGWKRQPAVCGLAGSCLLIGILARCGVFPWLGGWQGVTAWGGSQNGWVFGVWAGPMAMWMFLRVWPLLSCAPETVALGQGLCLLGALAGAFLATGQSDPRRILLLLASSQYGVLMSAAIVPDLLDLRLVALAAWGIGLAGLALYLSVAGVAAAPGPPQVHRRWSACCAWILLSGACPGAMFWIASSYLQAVDQRAAAAAEQIAESDAAVGLVQHTEALQNVFRPEPLPNLTWCAAWSGWLFFSAFAGWRAWRSSNTDGSRRGTDRIAGLAIAAAICSVLVAAILLRDGLNPFPVKNGLVWCGLGATVAGWLISLRICRDVQRTDDRLGQLGLWARLVKRELFLNDVISRGIGEPIRGLAWRGQELEETLQRRLPGLFVDGLIRPAVAAIEELRSQSTSFYAGALLLTIGSLLLTWLSLIG